MPFLNRITNVPVTTVMLENGCHYPLEHPALDTIVQTITSFVAERTGQ